MPPTDEQRRTYAEAKAKAEANYPLVPCLRAIRSGCSPGGSRGDADD